MLFRHAGELTELDQRKWLMLTPAPLHRLKQTPVGAKLALHPLRGTMSAPRQIQNMERAEQLLSEPTEVPRYLSLRRSTSALGDAGRPAEPVDKHVADPAFRDQPFNVSNHAGVKEAEVSIYKVDGDSASRRVADSSCEIDPVEITGSSDVAGLFSIHNWLELLGRDLRRYTASGRGMQVVMLAPSDDQDNMESDDNGRVSSHSGSWPAEDELPVRPIRVLIVDDHIVMRQGLAALLELEADLQVIGEASDGLEAIAKARELQPDVIVMDITMPGMNGIEATRVISKELPDCRIVALSMHETVDMADAMKEAGAAAYLPKGGPADQLLAAIRNR